MDDYLQQLRTHILSEGILDPEDQHHEFVSGVHGRKLDFDKILTASKLYEEWTDCYVRFIREHYHQLPNAILGVANGANRLALTIATKLGEGVVPLVTEKETSKSVRLFAASKDYIESYQPDLVLIVEDVGTSGTTSCSAYNVAIEAGAKEVSVLNTWQRNETLKKLDEAGISYTAMIKEPLPSYPPDDCIYCKEGSTFIPHD